jgi:hypothetical protein
MYKLKNQKKYIVGFALSLFFCYVAIKYVPLIIKEIELQNLVKENYYVELTTQNLQSEWDCLPDNTTLQEDFILKLMQRYAPDEYSQFNRGKEWVAEYRKKEISGLLTVEERKNAYQFIKPSEHLGVLYYFFPWTINDSISGHSSSKSLSVDVCALDAKATCSSTLRFNTNAKYGFFDLFYARQGIGWRVDSSQWSELVRNEYRMLKDKEVQITKLKKVLNGNENILYEARQNVSKMSADIVPISEEQEYVQREYKRLRCQKDRI